jgi:hypothetical protein
VVAGQNRAIIHELIAEPYTSMKLARAANDNAHGAMRRAA